MMKKKSDITTECNVTDSSLKDLKGSPIEFSETPEGYEARDRWARRYYDLNGAPEGPEDC